MDPKLEQLLLEKEYDALTENEKAFANNHFSKAQYTAFRQILLSSEAVFESTRTVPDPAIRKRLLRELNNNKQASSSKSMLHKLLHYPIPTWQVAAGFIFLMTCFGFFYSQTTRLSLDAENIYVEKTKRDDNFKNQPKATFTSRPIGADPELLNLFTGVQ